MDGQLSGAQAAMAVQSMASAEALMRSRYSAFVLGRLEYLDSSLAPEKREAFAAAWGSIDSPMGGMGDSGLGRRHGTDGILKYTESQTVSTARVINLDPPLGISQTVWQKALTPMIRAVQKLPGR